MVKKLSMILLLILVASLLSSCWSRRELNELAIITAMSIDKIKDQYKVSVQIISPAEIAGQQQTSRSPVSTYEVMGESIFETLRKLTTRTPRKGYMAHLRIVIIGEDLAREGINKVLDFLMRDHEIRTDFYLAVAKDQKGSDLLKILTSIDKIPANKIFNSIDSSENSWAPQKGVQLDELASDIISDGSNPVLTGLYYTGELSKGNKSENVQQIDSPSNINVDYLGIFKDDKLVDWLNKEESKGYNYIADNVNSTVAVLPCEEEGNVSIEIIRSSTNMSASVQKGKPKINIFTKIEANIGEVQCKMDLLNEKTIQDIERKTKERLKENVERCVELAKKNKTDIFGFGEEIRRADPKTWRRLKKDWHDEGFADLEIEVKSDVQIRRLGTITDTIMN